MSKAVNAPIWPLRTLACFYALLATILYVAYTPPSEAENAKAEEKSYIEDAIQSFEVKDKALSKEQLASHISDKYKINQKRAELIVLKSFEQGQMHGIDPILILAVIAKESSFKRSAVNNYDYGLMQVNINYHADKLDKGADALFDIDYNIQIGVEVLSEMFSRTKNGSEYQALRRYNGMGKKNDYPSEVLEIKDEFKAVMS